MTRTIETGEVHFFYRSKIYVGQPSGVDDLQAHVPCAGARRSQARAIVHRRAQADAGYPPWGGPIRQSGTGYCCPRSAHRQRLARPCIRCATRPRRGGERQTQQADPRRIGPLRDRVARRRHAARLQPGSAEDPRPATEGSEYRERGALCDRRAKSVDRGAGISGGATGLSEGCRPKVRGQALDRRVGLPPAGLRERTARPDRRRGRRGAAGHRVGRRGGPLCDLRARSR